MRCQPHIRCRFAFAVGAVLMAAPGIGSAAQRSDRIDALLQIATGVGRAMSAASVCREISWPRIKALTDKFSDLVKVSVTQGEVFSTIQQAYDQRHRRPANGEQQTSRLRRRRPRSGRFGAHGHVAGRRCRQPSDASRPSDAIEVCDRRPVAGPRDHRGRAAAAPPVEPSDCRPRSVSGRRVVAVASDYFEPLQTGHTDPRGRLRPRGSVGSEPTPTAVPGWIRRRSASFQARRRPTCQLRSF
jgi:hypothetical protein